MKRLMNYLRGMVRVRVEGPFPERLINLCAQHRVDFWGVEWEEEHLLRMTVRRRQFRLLGELAERVECGAQAEGSRGLPDFLLRFRRRYAFVLGLALSLWAVMFLSRFVLTIEVTGNQRLPTAVILTQLRQLGVRPGVYGPSIDRQQVAQEAQLALEDLAYMGINLYGTRLEVIVRERILPPELLDESGFYHVVAEADGIITHVEAERGQAVVAEGDTVARGEVVISGTVAMEPPLYSDLPTRYYQTHARGRVWARTWRTLTGVIPLETWVKEYTGGEKSVWSLEVLGRRLSLWGSEGDREGTEKDTQVTQAVLPGGVALPLSLTREVYRGYELKCAQLDLEAARAMVEEELTARLKELIGEDGTVEGTQFTSRVAGGLLQVTLTAECREEIGREVEGWTEETGEEVES